MNHAAYLGSRRKRALDLLVGAGALLLAGPLLAAAVVAIRLETHGHPVYRQRRVGRDGRPFELYKLRTMVSGAENMGKGLAVDEGDDRITRLGAWLRRTSFDEVPNLVNVLRGEMSLVGPRPTVQVQVDRYDERQRHRLDALPGITGWAQVNGRASLPWHERIELDLWYVEHASLRLDLKILARTAQHGVHGRRVVPRRDRGLARAAPDQVEGGCGEPGDVEDDRRGGRRVAHHGLQRLQPARPARPRAARPDPRHGAPARLRGPRSRRAAAALRPPRHRRAAAHRRPLVRVRRPRRGDAAAGHRARDRGRRARHARRPRAAGTACRTPWSTPSACARWPPTIPTWPPPRSAACRSWSSTSRACTATPTSGSRTASARGWPPSTCSRSATGASRW